MKKILTRLKKGALALVALLLPGCSREPALTLVLDGRVEVPAAERDALGALFAGLDASEVALVLDRGLLGGFGARGVEVRDGRVVGLATLGDLPAEPLAAFAELRRLVVYRAELRTFEGLGPWPRLEELQIELTPLETLAGLGACCPQLRKLAVSHGPIEDLAPLVDLPELEHLRLEHGAVKTFESAPELPSVKGLFLNSLPLESLAGLEGFSGLEELQLFGIKSLSRLAGLPPLAHLRKIALFQNGLTTLSSLPALPSLKRIETSDNKILSTQLGELPELAELEMHEEDLLSVELGELPCLRTVDLRGEGSLFKAGGRLERLVIQTQPSLEKLDLRRNHLRHLAGLEPQPALRQIDLDRNPFDDLERFERGFPALRYVSVRRTKVRAIPESLAQAGVVFTHDPREIEANMWEEVLREAFEKRKNSFVEELPGGGGGVRGHRSSCSFQTATFSTPRLSCTGSIDDLSGLVYLPLVKVDPLNPAGGHGRIPVRATIRTRQGRARIYLRYELDIRGHAEALASYSDRERPWVEVGGRRDPKDVKERYVFAEARPGKPDSTFGEAQILVDQVVVWVEGLDGASGMEYVLESPYR